MLCSIFKLRGTAPGHCAQAWERFRTEVRQRDRSRGTRTSAMRCVFLSGRKGLAVALEHAAAIILLLDCLLFLL